ncbi:hypothetical protein JCM19992_02220 [Thermostilla marina]
MPGAELVFACILLSACAGVGFTEPPPSATPPLPSIRGVLRVCPQNPLFFADGDGRAIYLAGHQGFVDLQDNSFNKPFVWKGQRRLDWPAYLDFLTEHRFNYVRNWIIWSTGSGSMAAVNQATAWPMPYRRVAGYGKARDGGDKFDLNAFDEQFFERMRRRCEDLQARGVYVSIMLFEVYGFLDGEACGNPPQTLWDGNVFNKANNINGIDTDTNGDGKGIEFFYTNDPRIRRLQRDYVKKVIDTVNHLDNVFFEIANELYAPQWQYEMIDFVKSYEKTKPKQHLVLMSPGGRTPTGTWRRMPRELVIDSPADCFAVAGSWNNNAFRRMDPPANNARKPGIVDMDHVAAGSTEIGYVWTAFTRGYHFNLYDKPFERPETEGPDTQRIRRNLTQVARYASQMNLLHTKPAGALAGSGFCLAEPGRAYVVYAPEGGSIVLDLSGTEGTFDTEWFDPTRVRTLPGGVAEGGAPVRRTAPFSGPAVLWLKRRVIPDTARADP